MLNSIDKASKTKRILKEIISFPCLNCRNETAENNGFCHNCFSKLPFVQEPLCKICGAENDGIFEMCSKCLKEDQRIWKKGISLMRLEGIGQQLVHRLKYGNETALARALGKIAAEKLKKTDLDFDCIVPIPLHWTRRLTRGYNQTALLAKVISKEIQIPAINILKRTKYTKRQAVLGRKKRLKNLDGAFAVKNRMNCENRKILLIDDVMTTGTTLSIATKTLLDQKAANVKVFVILRA